MTIQKVSNKCMGLTRILILNDQELYWSINEEKHLIELKNLIVRL
jgi:hypothetical protein